MKYRKLQNTDLNVSEVCFGTWPISGHGMGKVDEKESIETIHRALELGVNFIDTADMYGYGYAEQLLSKALDIKKHDVIIATKVGQQWDENGNLRINLSPRYVMQACENSLRRLQLETIDLYQLHFPDPKVPLESTMEAMDRLVHAGKIRYVGVSNFSVEQLEEARKYFPIVSNQVEYSLINRSVERELLPYCITNHISVLPYKVLARGILTGKFKEKPIFGTGDFRTNEAMFEDSNLKKFQLLVSQLEQFTNKYRCSLGQLAIAWALKVNIVPSVIIGAKSPKQIQDNCSGYDVHLSDEDLALIDDTFHKIMN